MTRATLCLLALYGPALSAQQPSLVGVWQVSYPAGARIENGTVTPLLATGLLTVVAKDDSLIGTLATNPTSDIPARPPARLTAKAGTGDVVFESRSEATLSLNGSERKATAVSTWRLAAQSDSLVGTVERKLEGFEMGNQGPQPVTGVRQKS
jgi:hypothetical protein